MFKDVTPLLADHVAFADGGRGARGALRPGQGRQGRGHRGAGLHPRRADRPALRRRLRPARKAGKLPAPTRSVTYDLEYGAETLQVHDDAIAPGERVLIIDDVLATGGTAAAAASLVSGAGAEIVGLGFLIELAFLAGAERIDARLTGASLLTVLTSHAAHGSKSPRRVRARNGGRRTGPRAFGPEPLYAEGSLGNEGGPHWVRRRTRSRARRAPHCLHPAPPG
jgi:adenine phosphoribosyltransferase